MLSFVQFQVAYSTISFRKDTGDTRGRGDLAPRALENSNSLKPLISYYGGKQRIASKIVDLIEKIPHDIYVEPFAGGAAVLYKKGLPSKECLEVLNDTNKHLINLYKVAKNRSQELKEEINKYRHSKTSFYKSLKIMRSQGNNLEKAAAAYVSVNQGFGKKLNQSGWEQDNPSNKRGWKNKKLNLLDAANRLKNVRLSCQDAIACIKKYDSPTTLFYLDPPYINTNQGSYKGYTEEDFRNLLKTISEGKGSFILSNYPQKIRMPAGAKKYTIKTLMTVNNKNKNLNRERQEIVWVWDRSKK